MTRTIIFHSDRFDLVSYGNGTAYAVHDNIERRSMFVQDDDASEFREEMEAYEAAFPDLPTDVFLEEQLALRE